MVQQCPNCGAVVGKLHMRCVRCGMYFCEDCVAPEEHDCPILKQQLEEDEISSNEGIPSFSYELYKPYISEDDLEFEEEARELSESEKTEKLEKNRGFINEQNRIFKERVESVFAESECFEDDYEFSEPVVLAENVLELDQEVTRENLESDLVPDNSTSDLKDKKIPLWGKITSKFNR